MVLVVMVLILYIYRVFDSIPYVLLRKIFQLSIKEIFIQNYLH